jgi:hypothetical protein
MQKEYAVLVELPHGNLKRIIQADSVTNLCTQLSAEFGFQEWEVFDLVFGVYVLLDVKYNMPDTMKIRPKASKLLILTLFPFLFFALCISCHFIIFPKGLSSYMLSSLALFSFLSLSLLTHPTPSSDSFPISLFLTHDFYLPTFPVYVDEES